MTRARRRHEDQGHEGHKGVERPEQGVCERNEMHGPQHVRKLPISPNKSGNCVEPPE